MKSGQLWTAVLLIAVASWGGALAQPTQARLIPFDPSIQVHVHEYDTTNTTHEARERFEIFPRHRVPQVRRIAQPGASLLAVNIRELALLPGDRLVVRGASNKTILDVSADNQSVAKRWLQRPPRLLWNHPLLTVGNRVAIEYWPSLRTLTLPIDRPQLDNPVVVIDSYSFALFPRSRLRSSDDESDTDEDTELESTVGETNEMKPAVCFKNTEPERYNKSRSVARLIIQRSSNMSRDSLPGRYATLDDTDTVGGLDPHDAQEATDLPPSGASYTFCTGWLVGRGGHMLTNYHCLFELSRDSPSGLPSIQSKRLRVSTNTTDTASPRAWDTTRTTNATLLRQVSVNFMAEAATCNSTVGFRTHLGEHAGEIDATSVDVLVANEALDYCLLKVVPNGTFRGEDLARKFGYLTLRESGPVDGEPVYIPQHPNGEPKTIASTKNGKPAVIRVSAPSRTRRGTQGTPASYVSVRYNADTAPGSSGSPVISQRDNTVVALHHAGTGGIRPGTGRMASGWLSRLVDLVDGDTSDASEGSDGSSISEDEYNVGIRIDPIVADLRERGQLPPCAVAQRCDPANTTRKHAASRASSCCDPTWL